MVNGLPGVLDNFEINCRRCEYCLMQVDPWLSVSAAHNIGEAVRQQVHKHHPNVTESFVHIGLSCKAFMLPILRHADFCRCIT